MSYEDYCKKVRSLIAQKDALYDIADRKLAAGNKTGARHMYLEIDECQAELNKLVNPLDRVATDEELTFKFDS